jgi:hypothetical protein
VATKKDLRTFFYVDKTVLDNNLSELVLELDTDFFTRLPMAITYDEWLIIVEPNIKKRKK